jgi:hypothetical protein
MLKTVQILFLLLFSAIPSAVTLHAQAQPQEVAPVPVQISAAKKVFISNAGLDGKSSFLFQKAGESDQPYNRFYAAMKSWGRYELASTPADADLVFEIRFAAPLSGCQSLNTYDPQFGITILDAKTHFTLWALSVPVEGAYRKATFEKNLDEGLAALMNNLKSLSAEPKR